MHQDNIFPLFKTQCVAPTVALNFKLRFAIAVLKSI